MRTVNNIEVGIRIRALRERHNLTREQLSEILYLIFDFPYKYYTFKHL